MHPLLRLAALQAIAYAERLALQILLTQGVKMLGEEKKANAVAYARTKWAEMTKDVPILNATTLDDDAIAAAVQAAFDFAGVKLNDAAKSVEAQVDPTLPQGGVSEAKK